MINKGKFTRLDISDDNTVYLQFDYKFWFKQPDGSKRFEIIDYLKRYFKGLQTVNVGYNDKSISIFLEIKKVDGEPFVLWLDEQAEALSRLCKNRL